MGSHNLNICHTSIFYQASYSNKFTVTYIGRFYLKETKRENLCYILELTKIPKKEKKRGENWATFTLPIKRIILQFPLIALFRTK